MDKLVLIYCTVVVMDVLYLHTMINNCILKTMLSESLKKVGFSDDFGFINYCFAKQFEDIDQFKKHVKEEYDNTVLATIDILVAFFELSTSYSNAHDYLYEPRLFCYKEINKKSFLTCVFCNLPPAELESPVYGAFYVKMIVYIGCVMGWYLKEGVISG
ncbi:uncharacterized protein LOC132945578 [Metopolophium dirhodum]|uniref:uncharacterized protein LOC132945578 n=1 Tax=Metopolophium dirhodum TaxID=44670 RepID=UPI0029906554|nr:uncharacterized protein LOC132945578 [Metopolophium dirhodum]